jgi:hypothetical protein
MDVRTAEMDVRTDEDVARLISEAQRVGVGLILFKDPTNFDMWDVVVDPLRHEPDPELLDQFVKSQLSENAKDKLLRWSK